ncbi:MAG TPA: VIT domain-containing protein [Candidatus Thermoplasmatota archaeon]|nr:VIT domain-containing protein [Candidatus Thermoplasmatota archaeon]
MRALAALSLLTLLLAPTAAACWAVAPDAGLLGGSATMPPQPVDEAGFVAVTENATVTTRIMSGYAVTEVSAVLRNLLDVPLSAQMRVPVPEGAFPTNLTLLVNGTPYYGKVVKAEVARAQYEAAKAEGRNAGLVAQSSAQLFTYDVAVGPRETVAATLRYEQFLARERGAYTFHLPLPVSEGAVRSTPLSLEVVVEDPRGIVNTTATGVPGLVTTSEGANGVRVAAATFTPARGQALRLTYETGPTPAGGLVLVHEDGGSRYFLHALAPAPATAGGILSKDVIFVLDVSGSMHGQKLAQMKAAAVNILGELRPGDTFNLATFSSGVTLWSDRSVAATPEAIARAQQYVRDLREGGGTNIHGALLEGLRGLRSDAERVPLLVFLTDGLPTAGETTDPAAIRAQVQRANEGRVALYTLGFGSDVDMRFLEAVALENGGVGRAIRDDENAAAAIGRFFETVATPVLTDARFTYGPGATDVTPARVSHLFAGSETVVVGRLPKSATELTYAVEATSAQGPFQAGGSLDLASSTASPFVGRLFAYRMLQATLERMKVEGETPTLVALATAQALEGGFVTPYTSFFVEEVKPLVPDVQKAVEERLAMDTRAYDLAYMGASAPKTVAATPAATWSPVTASPVATSVPKLPLADGTGGSANAFVAPADSHTASGQAPAESAGVPGPNFLMWLLAAAVAILVLRKRGA